MKATPEWRSKDAVALVTGGVSGLGLATTKRFLDTGAQVVVLDLKDEDVVRELGDRARFAPANVTDEKAVTSALDIADSLGPLRLVVNCAGTGKAIRRGLASPTNTGHWPCTSSRTPCSTARSSVWTAHAALTAAVRAETIRACRRAASRENA